MKVKLDDKALIIADVHIPRCNGPAVIYLKGVIERFKTIIILGDLFDRYLLYLSQFFIDVEDYLKQIWKYLQLNQKSKKVYYIVGNHETNLLDMGYDLKKILKCDLIPYLEVETQKGVFFFIHDFNNEVLRKIKKDYKEIIAGHIHKASVKGKLRRVPAFMEDMELFTLSPKGELFHYTEALDEEEE